MLALVDGVAAAAAAVVPVGDVPTPVPAGEGCVLVDFELTFPEVVVVVATLPAAAPAAHAFGAVLVAFVTTLPVGCCEVTPVEAFVFGTILERVLVA